MLYKQNNKYNKYYKYYNLTVNGGETRSYIIRRLDPYTEYIVDIQAFTRAGVSPVFRARDLVWTHEDGKFYARKL